MSDYLIYITEMTLEAAKECDPYEFNFDSDEAFTETMEAITSGHVDSIISFLHEFIDELSEADSFRLYPSTMAVLPMLLSIGQH